MFIFRSAKFCRKPILAGSAMNSHFKKYCYCESDTLWCMFTLEMSDLMLSCRTNGALGRLCTIHSCLFLFSLPIESFEKRIEIHTQFIAGPNKASRRRTLRKTFKICAKRDGDDDSLWCGRLISIAQRQNISRRLPFQRQVSTEEFQWSPPEQRLVAMKAVLPGRRHASCKFHRSCPFPSAAIVNQAVNSFYLLWMQSTRLIGCLHRELKDLFERTTLESVVFAFYGQIVLYLSNVSWLASRLTLYLNLLWVSSRLDSFWGIDNVARVKKMFPETKKSISADGKSWRFRSHPVQVMSMPRFEL